MKGWTEHIILTAFLLFASTLLAKEPHVELFAKGNDLYKEKNYVAAIALYDSIVGMGYESADLYYNLGNAYFKMGYLAPTILNYERAKKLDPSNEDVDFNLKIANLRVADRIEPVPELFFIRWVKDFVISQSSDGWAKMGVVFIWISFVCGALFIFVNNVVVKRLTFFLGVIILVTSIAFAALAYDQYQFQKNSQEGIIFVTNAYVKSAPDLDSEDLFMLREGVKVELKNTEGDWQRIQLADGKVGWIQIGQVERI